MKSLVRCAGSSVAAVTLELGLLLVLVSVLHLFYLAAAVLAGLCGFVVSFLINRVWAFEGRRGCPKRQLCKHAIVVGGGIALGTLLMWLLVSRLHLRYEVGWLGGGALVFVGWTYPMQRFFTYAPATISSAAGPTQS
jgi:putative flippase GtrA